MSNDIKNDLINWNAEQLLDDSPVYNSKDLINALNSIMPSLGSVILTTNNHVLSKQEDWDSITINTLNMFTTLANSGLPANDFPNNSGVLLVLGYSSYNIYIAISGEAVYYRLGDADWNKLLTSATIKDLTDSFATLTSSFSKLSDQQTTLNNLFNTFKDDTNKQLNTLNTQSTSQAKMLEDINTRLLALEDKIKADGLLTIDEFNKFKNQNMLDATNRIGALEKIVDRNYLTYKTISSTLYSIGDGISDDNINAILRVGGTLAMPIMVTVTSSTDSNIVMQSDDRVQQNINHIKDKGLAITMIKPHIGLAGGYDGLNRATYTPSDFDMFFKNWKDVMLHYAETCNTNGIPILCIGCEQEKCTDPKYISKWIDIYQSIKAKYPDLLITYAMEGNEAKDIDGHGQIAKAVDLVGINCYPNYINKNYDDSVTQDELIAGWYFEQDGNRYMDMFDSYVAKYGKPIFVTETGSMPWKDGLARLLSLQEGNQDFSGQAAAYQATFEAFSQNPNIVGISIWNTNAPFNFTSPNKTTESELVLNKYFKGGLI